MNMQLIAVFTTVGSLDEARMIARVLVEKKLVACAQITGIESFYAWNGAVQNDKEFRVMLKTTKARYKAVEAAIRALHSYALPAIHAVAVEHAYEPYATWVRQCSADE